MSERTAEVEQPVFLSEQAPAYRRIHIPMDRLRAGDLRYNMVIRPRDEIVVFTTEDRRQLLGTDEEVAYPNSMPISVVTEDHELRDACPIRPGDRVTLTIYELREPGVDDIETLRIDEDGAIAVGLIGTIHAAALTDRELENSIRIALAESDVLHHATVGVILHPPQPACYTIYDASERLREYPIAKRDFRLLDALANDDPSLMESDVVYVIRRRVSPE